MLVHSFSKYPTDFTHVVLVTFSARYYMYDIAYFASNVLVYGRELTLEVV